MGKVFCLGGETFFLLKRNSKARVCRCKCKTQEKSDLHHIGKKPTRRRILIQTSHTNCQEWWWRGDDLGLICSHRTWIWERCAQWFDDRPLCIYKYPNTILESNVSPSVRRLKPGQSRVMKQNNDPKHGRKFPPELLKMKTLQCLHQVPRANQSITWIKQLN